MSQPNLHWLPFRSPSSPSIFISSFFNILFGLQAINLQILGPLCALLPAGHSAFRMLPRPLRLSDHKIRRPGFGFRRCRGPESTAVPTDSVGHGKAFLADDKYATHRSSMVCSSGGLRVSEGAQLSHFSLWEYSKARSGNRWASVQMPEEFWGELPSKPAGVQLWSSAPAKLHDAL